MKIAQAFTFEAAHRLPKVGPNHRCFALHGHSYRIEVRLEGPVDPETGFVVDFFEIERVFQPVLARLDHSYLNDIAGLDNPTAELIARWIWQRIKPELPLLAGVVCYETPHCWAECDSSET